MSEWMRKCKCDSSCIWVLINQKKSNESLKPDDFEKPKVSVKSGDCE